MKVIEANLPRNGNFTRRSTTDEVILHHAEASSATVWVSSHAPVRGHLHF